MSLDDFNKKIELPGDAGPPSFEESEWDKMETLLDTHLPQKKDRRRFIFWLFALLISLGLFSGYYFMYKPAGVPVESVNTTPFINDHNSSPGTIEKTDQKTNNEKIEDNSNTVADKSTQPPADNNEKANGKTNLYQKNNNEKVEDNSITVADKNIQPPADNNEKVNGKINLYKKNNYNSNLNNLSVSVNTKINSYKRNGDENNMTSIFEIPSQNTNKTPYTEPKMETVQTNINTNNNDKPVVADTIALKTSKELADEKKNSKSDSKKIKSKNNLYITLSTGLEANGTKFSSFGAVTPVYGAGLQYSIGKKLFVRAGVLITKKQYEAKDKDYTRKSGTWMSNVTFDNIVAKCKVVEMPIAIGYILTNNKKTTIYATAGTSAYFMKKEDYQFYFKTMSGNDTTRNANFTNNSNHLFSSLNLSAGIEQKINNKLSITAEPIIKIPISGIGFGKVKLYSAGVVISAKIKLK